MGIQNLLKALEKITDTNAHIQMFQDLVLNKPTKKYLQFTLKCIRLLRHHNITPIIVFDGAQLPMKANEEKKRGESRKSNKAKALKAKQEGDLQQAYKYATMAVRITKEMVTAFINQCIKLNVEFVCAPYEADAQLAYLYKQQQIDFVISEDSDLLLFGVEKAFYKFNVDNGCGQFLDLHQLNSYRPAPNATTRDREKCLCLYLKRSRDRQLDLIKCCILSGCDYINSLPGIGLITAVKLCNQYKRIDHLIAALLERPQSKDAPKDYKLQFKRALLTFLHQTVYDTKTKTLTYLNPLTDEVEKYTNELKRHQRRMENNTNNSSQHAYSQSVYDMSLDFLGKHMEPNTARLIAEGRMDARSLQLRHLIDATAQNKENLNDEETDDHVPDGNRFFAASRSSQRKPTSQSSENAVFQCMNNNASSTNTVSNVQQNRTMWNALRQTERKPHVASSDEVRLVKNAGDGLHTKLDDLFTQFMFSDHRNERPIVDNDDDDEEDENEEWENTEDTFLDFDEKEHKDIFNITIADTEDELNAPQNYNKPLKKSRKRKRDEISHGIDVDTVSGYTPSRSKSKRKVNDGSSVQTKSNHVQRHSLRKTPKTPSSSFIQRTIPKNLESTRKDRSPSPESSLIGDLFSSRRSKSNRKRHQTAQNTSNTNRKTNESARKSIAMIGARHRPIDVAGDESDSPEITIVASTNKKRQKPATSVNFVDHFGEILSDREDEDDNEEGGGYSQVSQSQSERQMVDCLNQFKILSQSQFERKVDEERSETDDDDDDEEEIQILEKKGKAAPDRFRPKPFKPPKFKDGTVSPHYSQSAKKRAKTKANQAGKAKAKSKAKPKPKATGPKQTTLKAWFKKS